MHALRALLRAATLGLIAAVLLASCNHGYDGDYPRQQQSRDGSGGGGSGGY